MVILQKNYHWFNSITNVSGITFVFIAQPLSQIPYLLRVLRIKHMFLAREGFWLSNQMPKEKIKFWSEARLLGMLLIPALVIGLPCALIGLIKN